MPFLAPIAAVGPRPALYLRRAMRESLEVLRSSPFELRRFVARLASENPFLQPLDASARADEEERRRYFEETSFRQENSLARHLAGQMGFLRLSECDRAVAEEIAGRLNPDGYFGASVEEVAAACGESAARVADILARIQTLDPPGIGARSLQECLLLQLDDYFEINEASLKGTARAILENHFEDLARRRFSRIAAKLDISAEICLEAVRHIRRFDPKPGLRIAPRGIPLRIPELKLVRKKNEWRILYERPWSPVGLVPGCEKWLKDPSVPEEEKRRLREHLQAALSLVRGLEERQKTLTRLTRFVIDRQKAFLDRGEPALRPLRLKDAARAAGVNPSTVSRAIADKYIEIPRGVVPFRAFFSRPFGERRGRMPVTCSRESLLYRIRRLIEAEDKSRPFSDARIAGLLRGEGFDLSRRTVAHYRSSAGILPASYRKNAS